MKILINFVLFNPKSSANIAKNFIDQILKTQKADIFIHSNKEIEISGESITKFEYQEKFDFNDTLKKTLITLNHKEIEELIRYDLIFTVSDSNFMSFISLCDIPIQRLNSLMRGLLRTPKCIIVPLRFSEPFNSIDSLNNKILICNVQIFRILSSMALRTTAEQAVVFGFLAHRLGIQVVGVED